MLSPTSARNCAKPRPSARNCAKPRPSACTAARVLAFSAQTQMVREDLRCILHSRLQFADRLSCLRRFPAWCSTSVSFQFIILFTPFSNASSIDVKVLNWLLLQTPKPLLHSYNNYAYMYMCMNHRLQTGSSSLLRGVGHVMEIHV